MNVVVKLTKKELIGSFEGVALILFLVGLNGFVTFVTLSYPNAAIILAGFGLLFLLFTKILRKKLEVGYEEN
jgi:hypothetical protein